MSALTAPQREPIEADPPAEEPRRETGGDGAPVEASDLRPDGRRPAARSSAQPARRLGECEPRRCRRLAAAQRAASRSRRRMSNRLRPPRRPKKKTASSTPRRVVKTLLGLALVAAVGYEPLQRMAQTSSVEAIVNARVITLRAPIEGEVQAGPAGRDAGAALAPGDLLFRVVDPRADRGRVDDLSRQLAQARDERPRLAARLESARALLADLTEQTRQFREARIRQLEARHDALTADAAAAHARSSGRGGDGRARQLADRPGRRDDGPGQPGQARRRRRGAERDRRPAPDRGQRRRARRRPPRRVRRRQLQRSPDLGAARRRPAASRSSISSRRWTKATAASPACRRTSPTSRRATPNCRRPPSSRRPRAASGRC